MFSKLPSFYRKINTNEFQEAEGISVDGLEKEFSEAGAHDSPRAQTTRYLLYAFLCMCTVLLFVGVGYGFRKPHQHQNEDSINHSSHSPCGNSSAEARSLGCSFDQLMWAWYPPQCPHYANEEFINAEPGNPWRYYDGLSHGKAIFAEDENWVEVLDSGVQLWGERREHLTHCVYMFLSAGRIIWGGGKFVPKLVSSEHFDHCVAIVMDALRKDSTWFDIETSVPRPSFESC